MGKPKEKTKEKSKEKPVKEAVESGSESSDGEFGAFDFEAGADPVASGWDYSFAIPRAEREALERNRRAPVERKQWGAGSKRKVDDVDAVDEPDIVDSDSDDSDGSSDSSDSEMDSDVTPENSDVEESESDAESDVVEEKPKSKKSEGKSEKKEKKVAKKSDKSEKKEKKSSKKKSSSKSDSEEEDENQPNQDVEALTGINFEDLHLSKPLLKAVQGLGYKHATPIQAAVIPAALQGKDILASAATGSGKTAAFMLPILERLLHRQRKHAATRVLVLMPTRELAVQCVAMTKGLAAHTDIRVCLVVGGLPTKAQEVELRKQPDIVVATPGRMADHLRNSLSVAFEDIEVLVLDEADRLLDMGFKDEVEDVVRSCPGSRQTLLFSATLTKDVDALAKLSLHSPLPIAVDPIYGTASKLTQEVVRIRAGHESERPAIVLALCTRSFSKGVVIFVARRTDAHRMKIVLELQGLNAAELHGDLNQTQRLASLEDFRAGRADYLVATDIAARGLDIQGVTTVINMFMPRTLREYIHRVGRTARAGRDGRAVTLVGDKERPLLKAVIKHAQHTVKSRVVPQDVLERAKHEVQNLESEIRQRLEDEKVEKELDKAQMQAMRAHNLLAHADEIKSRPAKTWMVTGKERKKIQEDSYENAQLEGAAAGDKKLQGKLKKEKELEKRLASLEEKPKRQKMDGLSRKKKRALLAAQADAEENKGMQGKIMGSVKAKKREIRESKALGLKHAGISKEKKKGDKPKHAKRAAASKGASSLEKGIASGATAAGRNAKQPFKKKGNHAFKSKAKHKRRK